MKTDGTLWAWGNNNNGQLGDGTIVNKPTPTQININCSTLSTDEFYGELPFIYPNPVKDILNLNFKNNSEITSISIVNLEGKRLIEVKKEQQSVDISNLLRGIYICRIHSVKDVFNLKIIKE